MLVQYARHVVAARRVAELIEQAMQEGGEGLDELLKAQARVEAIAAGCRAAERFGQAAGAGAFAMERLAGGQAAIAGAAGQAERARKRRMSSAADRQRLRRQRARRNCRVCPVEVSAEAEDMLLHAGVLAEWDIDNRLEVGRAIERLLELLLLQQRHA